jgi:hypothetical protein
MDLSCRAASPGRGRWTVPGRRIQSSDRSPAGGDAHGSRALAALLRQRQDQTLQSVGLAVTLPDNRARSRDFRSPARTPRSSRADVFLDSVSRNAIDRAVCRRH